MSLFKRKSDTKTIFCFDCNAYKTYRYRQEWLDHDEQHERVKRQIEYLQMIERAVDAAWENNW